MMYEKSINFKVERAQINLSWFNVIDILQRMGQYFYSLQALRGFKGRNNIKGIYTNLGIRLATLLLNIYIKTKGKASFHKKAVRHNKILVSFTSFPARINNVHLVVDSIIRQDDLPYKVLLYLSKKQFPNTTEDLPSILKEYISDFFEVKWVEDDLRPHKKYYYAIKEYPEHDIITIDDDSYYQRDMITRLIKMRDNYPRTVCANNVHDIVVEGGNVLDYKYWGKNFIYSERPSHLYLAVGVGGVLYPAGIFDGTDLFNKKNIKELSLDTDDLWLKANEILNKVPVVTDKVYAIPLGFLGSQKVTLTSKNVNQYSVNNQNDKNWQLLNKEYNLNSRLIEMTKKY